MRKYFKILALSIIALLVSHVADAQWYVSGSVSSYHSNSTQSYSYFSSDTTYVRETRYKSNNLSLHPEVGYYYRPNMAVGCGLDFLTSRSKSVRTDNGDEAIGKMLALGLSPFFRWDFVTTEHLSVGFRTMGSVLWQHPINEGVEYKANDVRMELSLAPVMNYKFSDHWAASVYFGNLAMSHTFSKRSSTIYDSCGGITYNERKSHINGLDANLSMESWSLGLVYTF